MRPFFIVLVFCIASSLNAADPSTVAVTNLIYGKGYSERYRILADLDGDGHQDLILSQPIPLFGKMGGLWDVYLFRINDFNKIGSITAHPLAISLEADHDRNQKDGYFTRIWVYLRGSGSSGGLGYYRIGPNSIVDLQGIQIYPGDGGSDLGRAIYRAVMDNSEIPFRLQKSVTDEHTGNVIWKDEKP